MMKSLWPVLLVLALAPVAEARIPRPDPIPRPAKLTPPPRVAPPARLPVERLSHTRTISTVRPGFSATGVLQSAFGRTSYQPRAIAQRPVLPYLPEAGYAPPRPIEAPLTDSAADAPLEAEATVAGTTADGLPADPIDLGGDPDLTAAVQAQVDLFPALEAHVVVLDLNGRRRADVRTGAEMYPGSIAKLPLFAAALERIHTGTLPAARLIEIPPADTSRAPALVPAWEAVGRAIGDHRAANALLDAVGTDAIADTIRELGLSATTLERGFNRPAGDAAPTRMSAGDAAHLLYRVAREDFPTRAAATALRRALARQPASEGFGVLAARFPGIALAGLTAEARMKSGEDVSHDVALVQSPTHRYVLVAYTRHESDARVFLTRLALAVHHALTPRAGYLD